MCSTRCKKGEPLEGGGVNVAEIIWKQQLEQACPVPAVLCGLRVLPESLTRSVEEHRLRFLLRECYFSAQQPLAVYTFSHFQTT